VITLKELERSMPARPISGLRRAVRGVGLLAVLTSPGCRESPVAPPVPREPAFLSGRITQVGQPWGYLVEGTPGTSYQVDKAYFTVGGTATLVRRDGRPASAAELSVGRTVSLWITGVILESYPVQVEARAVVLEPDAPRTP
jgi:hypothetical protein